MDEKDRTTDEPDNQPVDTAIASDGLAEASSMTTVAAAEAQHPGLDASAPAASEETPSGHDTLVLAQTAEEVEAQYVNRAGGPEPTQEGDAIEEDAELAESAEGGISEDEAAEISEADQEREAREAAAAEAARDGGDNA